MTFNAYESSTELGQPIQFYRFTLGSTVWRYTSSDRDILVGGVLWKSKAIRDDGVKQSGQSVSDTLNIDGPNNIGPGAIFGVSPPQEAMRAEILRMHEGMTVLSITYVGEVVQVGYPTPGACRVTCQTLSATMRRQGLRLGWQRSCPHTIYDPLTCRVSKATWAESITLETVTGLVVVSAAFAGFPDNYFSGGFIEFADPLRGFQAITIESHIGNQVTMFDDTSDLYPGLIVTAYPGCNQTETACRAFGNILNYGGYKNMPGKSPFDGIASPMF